ncbi:MAG: single-stranded DNA-binding protein [Bacteroidales bacterium]|nr:single-stranded DNA-binding protein [Bacteroidales bacterium]MCB8999272.1 single-stranded DNA-binding protein [Bacteroidales bacterium]MCB9013058.1 single-stranded DNA-binding protein [Bacteroidales bacterium]
MSVNKVILVGNVGKDPETRHLEGGNTVCKFPLATSEVYKNRDGEKITNTEWHNIVLWKGLAEIAEKYVKKGSQLYIEGRIRSRSYTDQDNNTKYITEIIGDSMQMLGKRSDSGSSDMGESHSSAQSGTQPANSGPEDLAGELEKSQGTDDLPF